jgi:hypothetical protein
VALVSDDSFYHAPGLQAGRGLKLGDFMKDFTFLDWFIHFAMGINLFVCAFLVWMALMN